MRKNSQLEPDREEPVNLERKLRDIRIALMNMVRDAEQSRNAVEERGKKISDFRIALFNMLKDTDESKKELETLDKMKSDFIQIAVHELRTPLIAVNAGVELVSIGELGKLTKQQKEALNIAEQGIDVLTGLIDDMLDIMRIESGKMELMKESLSIKEIIGIIVHEFKPVIMKKKQKVVLKIPDSLPQIIGDPSLLAKLFNNLLSNAVKHTPDNGKITITAKDDKKSIHCAVTDTGIGISKKEIDKIFDRFYVVGSSLSRKQKGIGLGLAICKDIVESHNGKIWAESTLGKGSTFHVILPKMEGKG